MRASQPARRRCAQTHLRLSSLSACGKAEALLLASTFGLFLRSRLRAGCGPHLMLLRTLLTLLAVLVTRPANAHPHVWVTFHSEVVYASKGVMAAVRHIWTFDDMYSAFALQGIAHAKKGEYTRTELTSLAQLNM